MLDEQTKFTGLPIIYLPRKKEIKVPNAPINPRPKINNPIGTRLTVDSSSRKVAMTNGAGGVKVGRRVGVAGAINAAASVGLMVGIEIGVGVGGDFTDGSCPL